MCTLSVLPRRCGGLRLMINRDEQRTRPESLAPRVVTTGDRSALMPIDPVSGGSWVGVNDAGVVASLLNRSSGAGSAARFRERSSRGEIVPALLASDDLDRALALARAFDPSRWPPFTLFIAHGHSATVLTSDGASMSVLRHGDLSTPWMLASSGLGDELVRSYRKRVFAAALAEHADPFEAQRAFHAAADVRHSTEAPLMARADARTVSQTTIDLNEDGITLHHVWLDDSLRESREASQSFTLARPLHRS